MPSPSEIESAARIQFREMMFNKDMSTRHKLRFGTKGSLVVDLTGDFAGRWHSFEDGDGGWVDGISVDKDAYRSLRKRPMAYTPDPDRIDRAADILARCHHPKSTAVEVYLESRGIYCELPHSIKFCQMPCAMAGLFQNAVGDIVAVQLTYLTRGGGKDSRRTIQKQTFATGENWHRNVAIHTPGKGELILCEGIETALSIFQVTGRPVRACTSSSILLNAFVRNKKVTIAHDGDEPGSKADKAYQRIVQSFLKKGKQVRLAKPPVGKDFNDVLVEDGEGRVLDLIEGAELCQRS